MARAHDNSVIDTVLSRWTAVFREYELACTRMYSAIVHLLGKRLIGNGGVTLREFCRLNMAPFHECNVRQITDSPPYTFSRCGAPRNSILLCSSWRYFTRVHYHDSAT